MPPQIILTHLLSRYRFMNIGTRDPFHNCRFPLILRMYKRTFTGSLTALSRKDFEKTRIFIFETVTVCFLQDIDVTFLKSKKCEDLKQDQFGTMLLWSHDYSLV